MDTKTTHHGALGRPVHGEKVGKFSTLNSPGFPHPDELESTIISIKLDWNTLIHQQLNITGDTV